MDKIWNNSLSFVYGYNKQSHIFKFQKKISLNDNKVDYCDYFGKLDMPIYQKQKDVLHITDVPNINNYIFEP